MADPYAAPTTSQAPQPPRRPRLRHPKILGVSSLAFALLTLTLIALAATISHLVEERSVSSEDLPAPQAGLMATMAQGVVHPEIGPGEIALIVVRTMVLLGALLLPVIVGIGQLRGRPWTIRWIVAWALCEAVGVALAVVTAAHHTTAGLDGGVSFLDAAASIPVLSLIRPAYAAILVFVGVDWTATDAVGRSLEPKATAEARPDDPDTRYPLRAPEVFGVLCLLLGIAASVSLVAAPLLIADVREGLEATWEEDLPRREPVAGEPTSSLPSTLLLVLAPALVVLGIAQLRRARLAGAATVLWALLELLCVLWRTLETPRAVAPLVGEGGGFAAAVGRIPPVDAALFVYALVLLIVAVRPDGWRWRTR